MFDATKKAILWDLDETLYSRRDAARRVFPGMFRACLYEGRSDEFLEEAADYMMTQVKRNSMTHEDGFRALLQRYPSDKPFDYADCVAYYYAHMRSYVAPSADAVAIIKKLKAQGVKMAIVTNVVPELLEHQKKKVQTLGIAELFDAIVYSAELGVHKPDRRIFDHAAKLLGVSNAECLFVGDDAQSDVVGALNAGMEVVWLDRWQDDDRFDDNPMVHRVSQLEEYFWDETKFLPLFAALDKLTKDRRSIVAIDGGSASGKTTLSQTLAQRYHCTVFHMDDFFLRPEQRTPQRYAEIGGNVDRERFMEEVLQPLSRGEAVRYRRFDCAAMALGKENGVEPDDLIIVEGAYSMHPELAEYYDFSAFLQIDPQLQRQRILRRNGERAQQFFDRWIPMENTYFEKTDIISRCDISICIE